MQLVGRDGIDARIGAWIRLARGLTSDGGVVSFDGKSLRGSVSATEPMRHLLAAYNHADGTVLAQKSMGAKTNEIPMLTSLLSALRHGFRSRLPQ